MRLWELLKTYFNMKLHAVCRNSQIARSFLYKCTNVTKPENFSKKLSQTQGELRWLSKSSYWEQKIGGTLSMSKKRFLSIVLSAVMILSLACSALAVGQSGRYIGNSTVNGSIYQTYYQVDAQTRTGIKSISVSGTLYEKGTFGTWQRVSISGATT